MQFRGNAALQSERVSARGERRRRKMPRIDAELIELTAALYEAQQIESKTHTDSDSDKHRQTDRHNEIEAKRAHTDKQQSAPQLTQ